MSNQDNTDAILAALRRAGLVDVSPRPIVLSEFGEQRYWHVVMGAFDTMVDFRDASDQESARTVAFSPLQPWYVRESSSQEWLMKSCAINETSRTMYIEWLKRGVR